MNKKIIAFVLALTMCMGLSVSAFAEGLPAANKDIYVIAENYNIDVSERLTKQSTADVQRALNTTAPELVFELDLDDLAADVEGSITIDETNHDFVVSGNIDEYVLSDGNTGYIGVLSGYMDNGSNISLTVHTIPVLEHSFINVSIGTVAGHQTINALSNSSKTYVFGDYFDGMNELVDRYVAERDFYSGNTLTETATATVQSVDSINSVVDSMDINSSMAVVSAAATDADYYPIYRNMSAPYYRIGFTTDTIQLISTCLYAPIALQPGILTEAYAKVNGHQGNALYFAQRSFYGVISTYAEEGVCSLSSSDNYLEFDNPYPTASSFSVDFDIPYMLLQSVLPDVFELIFAIFPVSVSIPIFGVRVTESNNENSSRVNKISWWFNHGDNISWIDSDPVTSKSGYAGRARMAYIGHVNTPSSVPITASGEIVYTYQARDGLNTSLGSFTVNATTSASIRID